VKLKTPYLLFLGDAEDQLAAKTALGVKDWRPDWCLGQFRLPGCRADLGLPDLSFEEARAGGAETLIVGVANRGGVVSNAWVDVLLQALNAGFDIASGLHNRLRAVPALADRAAEKGLDLFDVRHFDGDLSVATGVKRQGKRLLTVGTDCSVGKMYTSLAIHRELRERGIPTDFRATGQTGIFIAGGGISVDAVVADFISGAAESLSPDNAPDHWDIVEGQGSLFHASFAGVSLGLLHGSQPDLLVMCHEPTRAHMRGLPNVPLPGVRDCVAENERAGRLTNTDCRCVGVSVNTSGFESEDRSLGYLEDLEAEIGLPCVDPFRTGVERIVDMID